MQQSLLACCQLIILQGPARRCDTWQGAKTAESRPDGRLTSRRSSLPLERLGAPSGSCRQTRAARAMGHLSETVSEPFLFTHGESSLLVTGLGEGVSRWAHRVACGAERRAAPSLRVASPRAPRLYTWVCCWVSRKGTWRLARLSSPALS